MLIIMYNILREHYAITLLLVIVYILRLLPYTQCYEKRSIGVTNTFHGILQRRNFNMVANLCAHVLEFNWVISHQSRESSVRLKVIK